MIRLCHKVNAALLNNENSFQACLLTSMGHCFVLTALSSDYWNCIRICLFGFLGMNMWFVLLSGIYLILNPKCAEVAVLCITKSGEVLNYQAFTNDKGIYRVAETMPESERWDACLARPISSFHKHCTHLGSGTTAVKFTYNRPSGYSHTVRSFLYRPDRKSVV